MDVLFVVRHVASHHHFKHRKRVWVRDTLKLGFGEFDQGAYHAIYICLVTHNFGLPGSMQVHTFQSEHLWTYNIEDTCFTLG
jgi:hypothetical protein